MTNEDISKLSITARLMAREAKKRGYQLTAIAKTSSDFESPVIIAEKAERKIYFKSSQTNLGSPLSRWLAYDKLATYDILRKNDLPTPQTIVLSRKAACEMNISDEIYQFLREFSPLVVKPSNTDHGNGITVDISNIDDLTSAISYAIEKSENADILLQQQINGKEFRFLVLNGKVIAVANRRPPFVVGDGIKTVSELIETKNTDSRRGENHDAILTKIDINEVEHFIGNNAIDEIPNNGEIVQLLKTSNLSRGGESIDVTDIASPILKNIAEYAAKTCLLGIAGVDIITTNIEDGDAKDSVIIEVNATPGLRMHQFPTEGKPRDIVATIWDELEKNASIYYNVPMSR